MRSLSVARSFAQIFTAAVALAFAFNASAEDVFEKPSKQLKGNGMKVLSIGNKFVIPVLYSENLIAGVHKAIKGGAHAKVTAANVSITPELGTRLANELLADLVAKLKAAGREVILYQDCKDSAAFKSAKLWQPDKTHMLPIYSVNFGYGEMDFLVSVPTGMEMFHHISGVAYDPGAAMRFAKLGKELDAIVLVPSYRYQTPVLTGKTNLGINKHYASVGVAPSMEMAWGGFQFLSAKGAWGSYMMNGVDTVTLAEDVGELQKTSESRTSDTSLFDFGTFRAMAKGGYLMTVDDKAYYEAALKAGKELNTHFVSQLK